MNTHREKQTSFFILPVQPRVFNGGRRPRRDYMQAWGKVSRDWRGGTGNSKAGGETGWGSGGGELLKWRWACLVTF